MRRTGRPSSRLRVDRDGAPVGAELRAGRFEHDLLTLKLDQAASDRRTRAIEEKLVQLLSKYLGREIRVVFEIAESGLNSPARQRVQAEQDRAARAASAFEADPAVKGLA